MVTRTRLTVAFIRTLPILLLPKHHTLVNVIQFTYTAGVCSPLRRFSCISQTLNSKKFRSILQTFN